ncbi:MAG TPA: SIS domain-containing protein [Chthonomonadaceae bacterium]|nr:SIS domain-containing protein [Chthonomonadaceae bacterium]
METRTYITAYLDNVKDLLNKVDMAQLERMVEALLAAWRDGKRVLLMGNGGSSSSVSHIVNDLQKNIYLEAGRPLRTLCLSDCTPLMMAWANDTAWENIFAPQVECWTEPGDVVIGVSGSGNSMNVINGIAAANRAGATTFGLAGFQGGKLKDTTQCCLVVPSENMQRIEDVHMILLHVLFSTVLERAKAEAGRA